ncbi:hypothetical protein ACE193_11580 [Bernardetia sp. OM2101]
MTYTHIINSAIHQDFLNQDRTDNSILEWSNFISQLPYNLRIINRDF